MMSAKSSDKTQLQNERVRHELYTNDRPFTNDTVYLHVALTIS
jgi:hypothetical protein